MLGGWSVFRHMSCFGRAWPPAHPVPSLRPYFQAWHVRKPRRCRLTEGWASSLRRQQGRAGLQVVLSVAVPWEAPCACRPVRSYVHKQCSAVLWVGSVVFVWSCVFWGILKLTAALSPDLLLLPFQTASWVHLLVHAGARGLCHPRPPPPHHPFSFGALDAQTWVDRIAETAAHSCSLSKALLLGVVSLSPLAFPRLHLRILVLFRPHSGAVVCPLPAPCRVLFCIYVVVVVLISFFLCVRNIMYLRNTHVFEWTLLHLFWLLHGTLSFYRPSVNRLQSAVLSSVRCLEAFFS